jgi:hypothetical protein
MNTKTEPTTRFSGRDAGGTAHPPPQRPLQGAHSGRLRRALKRPKAYKLYFRFVAVTFAVLCVPIFSVAAVFMATTNRAAREEVVAAAEESIFQVKWPLLSI